MHGTSEPGPVDESLDRECSKESLLGNPEAEAKGSDWRTQHSNDIWPSLLARSRSTNAGHVPLHSTSL